MKKLIAIAVAVALVITLFSVVIPVGAQDDISFNPYPPALFMRVDKGYDLPFSDINVRRALAMGIDNEGIKDIYYGGNAEVLAWPIMPTPEFIDMYTPLDELPESTRELYGYNPTKAKQMLADAGYPDGFMATVVCNVYQADLLLMIRDYFAQIGVVLVIEVKTYDEWKSIGTNKTYECMYMHSVDPTIPFEFSRLLPGMPHNYSMVDDPVINEAYEAIAAAEEPEKRELMKAIVPYILEQGYILVPPVPYTKTTVTTVHEPMTGQKLVGYGRLGSPPDGSWLSMSWFVFTNPDCVSEITIEQVSLIRWDGIVIYEGPLLRLVRDENGEVVDEIPITESMKPHEIRGLGLCGFMKDPEASNPDRWLTFEEARNLKLSPYTLEIFWSWSDKEGLPLIGWASESKRATDPALQELVTEESELLKLETSHSRVPMVNMEQTLLPEKEKTPK